MFTLVFYEGSHFTDKVVHTVDFTIDTPMDHIEFVAKQINKNMFNNKRMWIDLFQDGDKPVTHWIFNY